MCQNGLSHDQMRSTIDVVNGSIKIVESSVHSLYHQVEGSHDDVAVKIGKAQALLTEAHELLHSAQHDLDHDHEHLTGHVHVELV